MRVLTALTIALVMAASAMGAVVTVTDIASSDVPTAAMTAFPVPAAAGWTGGANLIFDNSTAGLAFSTTPYPTGNALTSFPLVNSQVAIHTLFESWDGAASVVSDDNYYNGVGPGYYTNTQGSASDAGADNRFPYNIPRPGRDCGADFSAFKFDLASTATQFGVFLAAHSNNFGGDVLNDYNYVQLTGQPIDVYVLGAGDTIATADHYQVNASGYAPFLMVSDPTGIESVVVLHDCGQYTGPTFGFFDVYSNVPEPASLSLLALGALSLIRRRK